MLLTLPVTVLVAAPPVPSALLLGHLVTEAAALPFLKRLKCC